MEQKQNTKLVRMVTLAGYLTIVVIALVNTWSNVLVNHIVDAFALAGASQGLISSLLNAGSMVALFATPLLQGRMKKMTVLLVAAILQGVLLLVCGASPGFYIFLAASALMGTGSGLTDTYANSAIVDVGGENRRKYLGVLHALFGVGSLATPLLIQFFLRFTDWRGTFYIAGGIVLALSAVVFALSKKADTLGGLHAMREEPLRGADLAEYFKNPHNILLLLTCVFCTAMQAALLVWNIRYMTLRFNNEALGAISITVFWVAATINRLFALRLKVKPMRLLLIGALVSAAIIAVGIALGNAVWMVVAMGLLGLTSGHFMPVLFAECAVGYAGKTTMTTAALMIVMGAARIVVPLLMAYVTAAISVTVSMLLPIIFSLLAALFASLTARRERRDI